MTNKHHVSAAIYIFAAASFLVAALEVMRGTPEALLIPMPAVFAVLAMRAYIKLTKDTTHE